MKRKYDLRNKRSFLIIVIISIIMISIFSFFIYKFVKIGKVEYNLSSGMVVMDNNNDSMVLKDDATLKMKWTGNYYLKYKSSKKEVILSKNVITYSSDKIGLYGKFFEVRNKDDIVITKDETIIKDMSTPRFYKIEDRKYLLISGSIISSDNVLDTTDFLLVELDKQGNAKLTNNKVNLKTISKTTLVTTGYEFDIANEMLIFGDEKLDLKKIIGTSNLYKPDDGNGNGNGTKDGNDDDANNTGGNGNNNDNTEPGKTNTGNVIVPNTNGDVVNNTENNIKKDDTNKEPKSTVTSVVGVTSSYSSITCNYVIYDPYNNYISTFVEVRNALGNLVKKVSMSKNSNSLVIDSLAYNTEYTLLFKYSYIEDNKEVFNTYYEEKVTTKVPNYEITLNKVSNITGSISYNIILDNKALSEIIGDQSKIILNTSLLVGDTVIKGEITKDITYGKIPKYVSGTFSLPQTSLGDIVTIKLDSVTLMGQTITYNNVYYKYVSR